MTNDAIKAEYAKMFISMSTDYLMGGITWETYVRNTEIAARNMLQLTSAGSVEENSGIEISQ